MKIKKTMTHLTLFVITFIFFSNFAQAASNLTPINASEAIIEVFWDPATSGLKDWQITDGSSYGLKIDQFWCRTRAVWTKKPKKGPVLQMTKDFNIDCSDYDKLMISALFPDKGKMKITLRTDLDQIQQQFDHLPNHKSPFSKYTTQRKEYFMDLKGIKTIKNITLEFFTPDEGFGGIYIYWIGLQNSEILPSVINQYSGFDPNWPRLLKPKTYHPKFQPTNDFLIDKDDLEKLRRVHQKILEQDGTSNFIKEAEFAIKRSPESMINKYANFNREMFARDRDFDRWLVSTGVNAALAGLITEDEQLLRLAARYALSITACTYWDAGFICYYPKNAFEQRSFTQSVNAHDVAMIYDLAGEMFTEAGKQFIRRKLAEHAIGQMNFVYWNWEYIYHCNQAAWFSPGRLLAYLTLEKSLPRVKPYTDLAYNDLIENLNYSILTDGGYPEGPTYFRSVGRDGGLSLYYYSRARNKQLKDVIPDRMKLTDNFGEAIYSTVPENDIIPICDSSTYSDPLTKAVMATIFPDSAWARMLEKTIHRKPKDSLTWPLKENYVNNHMGSLSDYVLAWKLAQNLDPKRSPSKPAPFVFLPVTGYMASTRTLDGKLVKLFIMGNNAGSGHTHEDKGSFILEVAGEVFALDPGIGSYNDPVGEFTKYCQSHNMLVPIAEGSRPAPQNPIPVDVKPVGKGDETSFKATIDATPGWEKYYRKWIRSWNSPTPDTLIITDNYELIDCQGVIFYWQTRQNVEVIDNMITLTGKNAKMILETPTDCTIEVKEITKGRKRKTIEIKKLEPKGNLEIKAKIFIQN